MPQSNGCFQVIFAIILSGLRQYPSEAQGMSALWEKPVLSPVPPNWDGPYIDRKIPKDPWNNDYIYKNPGENNLPFSIMTYGADGKTGGEGANADIHSWD